MKGLISKTLMAVCVGCGLAAGGGCATYDPCYPHRYKAMARMEHQAAFEPQVQNGHVLDQTVWNEHFEAGSDRLSPAGMEHLAYLARRRPEVDPRIFVQSAQDVAYDAGVPNRLVEDRNDLDRRRTDAVEKYLAAQTAGRPVNFEVTVHDPSEVGMRATPANLALQQHYLGFRGNLPATTGVSATGGGGVGGSGR